MFSIPGRVTTSHGGHYGPISLIQRFHLPTLLRVPRIVAMNPR